MDHMGRRACIHARQDINELMDQHKMAKAMCEPENPYEMTDDERRLDNEASTRGYHEGFIVALQCALDIMNKHDLQG